VMAAEVVEAEDTAGPEAAETDEEEHEQDEDDEELADAAQDEGAD